MNENPFDRQAADSPQGASPSAPWNEKETCRAFSRVGFALTALLAATFFGQIVIGFLAEAMAWGFTDTWWYGYAVSFASIYGCGMPAMWLVLRTLPKAPFNRTYLNRLAAKTPADAVAAAGDGQSAVAEKPAFPVSLFFLILLVAVGYLNIGAQIGEECMSTLSSWMGYDYSNSLNDLSYTTPWWGMLLFTVILAPLAEEFLFRRLLIDRLRRYGDVVAILISAGFFALFHGNLYQLFYALLIGLLMGYLYTRTGQLRWSVALHMLLNFLGTMVPMALRTLIDPAEVETVTMEFIAEHAVGYAILMLYSLLLYGAMIASVILTVVMGRRLKLGRGDVVMPRGARFGIVMGNAGMMMAVIFYLLTIALALLPV